MIPIHSNVKDLSGQNFGRWTVIQYAGKSYWLCRCQCGVERHIFTGNLSKGHSNSCGCLRDELATENKTTHGKTGSPEYRVWAGIKRRCLNPNDRSYARYGEQGVTICDRWRDSFECFLSDIGTRPTPEHSIDRVDNDKGYAPDNCRWATRVEQARNKRTNRRITCNNRTKTLSEWSQELGICHATIQYRLRAGWDIETALNLPPKLGRNKL